MSDRCCEGIDVLTPVEAYNRPGLTALDYRAGTHSAFLQSMKARLSSGEHSTLTARDANDPAIAILDAWATVAHVLCFYQERICNENYLKTATEPKSVLELARLLGYVPPPGVAASVHLVFTMQEGYEGEVPQGTRAQSVPGPGEQGPQAFETSEALQARAAWNALTPRLRLPQSRARLLEEIVRTNRLYLKGVDSNLGPNAPILIDLGLIDLEPGADGSRSVVPAPVELFLRARSIEPDLDADRTLVTFQLPTNTRQRDVGWEEKRLQEEEKKRVERSRNVLTNIQELIRPRPPTIIRQRDVRLEEERLLKKERELSDQITNILDTANGRLKSALVTEEGKTFHAAVGKAANGSREVLDESADIRRFLGALARLTEADKLLEVLESWRIVRALRLLTTGPTEDTEASEQVDEEHPPSADVAADPASATEVSQSNGGGQLIQAFAGETGPGAEITPALTDAAASAFEALAPGQAEGLFESPSNGAGEPAALRVYALRTTASLFGHNAPKPGAQKPYGESRRQTTDFLHRDWRAKERPDVATLDGLYKQILPDSWIVFEMATKNVVNEQASPEDERSTGDGGATNGAASDQASEQTTSEDTWSNVAIISRVKGATERSRADYGITSARNTGVMLDPGRPWFSESGGIAFGVIRRTSVHAQSEPLELAETPLEEPVNGNMIELDTRQKDLRPGRSLIVSGEPQDRPGVLEREHVELERVEHELDGGLSGGRWTSTLVLKRALSRSYRRESFRVHANVARATHGETHSEVLGSGDSRTKMQRFTLRQSPLTYLPVPDGVGGKSTLGVRVDKVYWQEARSLMGLGPKDRRYIIRTNEDETTLLFGDGSRGALIPSGTENVEVVYRTGSGQSGNVEAGQIGQLATRPLGVTGVTNPMPATGGVDREPPDDIRRNASLPLLAMERVISVPDFAAFARAFAGIGKADATRIGYGPGSLIHLTIAGRNDAPISEDSDLYKSLVSALRKWGDPWQPFEVKSRELFLMLLETRVRVLDEYEWEDVEPRIRSALLDEFGFRRRELGQHVTLSEVTSAIHNVAGVDYVDVDFLGGLPEEEIKDIAKGVEDGGGLQPGEAAARIQERIVACIKSIQARSRAGRPRQRIDVRSARKVGSEIRPAQLAFLTPAVPQTLQLSEIRT